MTRNRHILHMPVEWMNWMDEENNQSDLSILISRRGLTEHPIDKSLSLSRHVHAECWSIKTFIFLLKVLHR
jgi:hypothetical protein